MSFGKILLGWDVKDRIHGRVKQAVNHLGRSKEALAVETLAEEVRAKLVDHDLIDDDGLPDLAVSIAKLVLGDLMDDPDNVLELSLLPHLAERIYALIKLEGLFVLPDLSAGAGTPTRGELWEMEDALKRTGKQLANYDEVVGQLIYLFRTFIRPVVERYPGLLVTEDRQQTDLVFNTSALRVLDNMPALVEQMVQLPFAPDFETYDLLPNLRARIEYNSIIASGGNPNDQRAIEQTYKPPTKSGISDASQLVDAYLGGTPLSDLYDIDVPIALPQSVRFQHHQIIAGSGHGKTQTIQRLVLHDLEAVARGEASVVVIDSQSDLINTISGLEMFAAGGALADRLCIIDPTDVEYPVALNLFDANMDRYEQYSQLERERLTNGVLELYDFVLGSLLDAGMTQKQSVVFRYITRLLLHIPGATIHTLRELLERDGYAKHEQHIQKLQGTARSFFENEFMSKDFVQTKSQVLRRLYGILENQTFERMFSHPKSKLDLFTELNAGKVILISTAKDLLKENGAEIFGRFFIAMIAQAAQERAVIPESERKPTFVYVDEASDYFDRTTSIILSQARKYKVGMILANQFLGQMDHKLQEALSANTSIKFAGGVSAKDARALASDLRTEPSFIEDQAALSFAAFVAGQTKRAVSLAVEYGAMEKLPRMSAEDKATQRDAMRGKYAVHYTEAMVDVVEQSTDRDGSPNNSDDDPPTAWD